MGLFSEEQPVIESTKLPNYYPFPFQATHVSYITPKYLD